MNNADNIALIGSIIVGGLLATLTDRMVRGTRARRLMVALAVFLFVAITAAAFLIQTLK
jgi:hypothetical protein